MNSSSSIDASGSLLSGSADNVRWQIVSPNTSSGTFGLLVRQGNDNTNNPIILETWTNLSLDPKAPNFISNVIGDYTFNYNATNNQIELSGSYPNASRYLRVKSVALTTPDYFDNTGTPKSQFTGSIPVAASGSFTGATDTMKGGAAFYDAITTSGNTQGLDGGSYTNMINLLSNQDDYRFNILLTPGLFNSLHADAVSSIVTSTQGRGDNIFVLDLVPYGSSISTTTTLSYYFFILLFFLYSIYFFCYIVNLYADLFYLFF